MKFPRMSGPASWSWVLAAAVLAGYFLTAKLGLLLALEHTNASPVWPATGVALSAVMLFGYRIWPAIMSGAFLANVWTLSAIGSSMPIVIVAAAGTAAGNTLEALIGGYLIRRFSGGRNPFDRLQDVLRFVFFGALASTVVSAAIGVGMLCLVRGEWSGDGLLWLTWWLGDATGALVIVPLFLTWRKRKLTVRQPGRIAEALLLAILLLSFGEIVFNQEYPLIYLFLPLLIWLVVRFGEFESACAILLISIMAITRTVSGSGPFVSAALDRSLLILQGYIGVVSVTAMVLTSVTVERLQAEETIRKRESDLREAQRVGMFGSWDWDAVTGAIAWSPEYYRIYNLDPALPTPNYLDHLKVYTHESAVRLDEAVAKAMQTGEPYELELEIADPGARTRWVLARGGAKHDADGRIVGLRGTAQDITARKRAEEVLREKDAFILNILETVDEGFILVDRQFRILSVNRAFCRSADLEEGEVLGRLCYEVFHRCSGPCFHNGEDCAVVRTFETGVSHAVSHTHVSENGTKQHVEIKSYPVTDASGNVVSAIETINDVTEQVKLQEQLRHAQKMEAIGTLAGGIAHDFNNMLNVIIGYGNLMQMRMKEDDPLLPQLKQMLAAGERAAELTKDLLLFSRKQTLELKPQNINGIIEDFKKMLARIIGEDIDLRIHASEEVLTVLADRGHIEQVLMNLAANARDAMQKGGMLSIETRGIWIDSSFVKAHGYGTPGKYAVITVTDTGTGIDEQTRERIFEPYFTTKETGRGTGLGLSIVFGIVHQHNGHIHCYSEPGKGTTFTLYLPCAEVEGGEAQRPEAAMPRGGMETILVAEDDPTVRMFARIALESFGYTVIEATDGDDAVSKFRESKDSIRLLILDVIMPGKGGRETYEEIKGLRQDIKVVFMSGYTPDILQGRGFVEEGMEIIAKPVSPHVLLAKVREVLDQ